MRVRAKSDVNSRVLDDFENPHLTPNKEYLVVGYDDKYLRVLDDEADPVLYPRHLFDDVDPCHPDDWVRQTESDGSYYVDPPECAAPGFYEDFHDGRAGAKEVFRRLLERLDRWERGRTAT